jgi:hypothetical protein
MKTRLAILAVLAATAGISTGASADILAPAAPAVSDLNAVAPVLFPSEQGAFKGLEVATQLVEASILQQGCDKAEYDLNIATKNTGAGKVYLDGVVLNVVPGTYGPEGRIYNVNGAGPLGDLSITNVVAKGSYNIGSGIQELTTDFDATSLVSEFPDHFRGTIIKDYARLSGFNPIPEGYTHAPKRVSTVVDYGYQQIQKNWYVAAKYWQQSQTWRQNGVRPGTWWVKTRVAPEGDCTIVVHLEGTNGKANQDNAQGFNETGTISVNVSDAQGVPGVDYKN